jgi:hypothetical protein
MARILVMSFSELARDPRVDRQVHFLSEQHDVVTAGFAPSSNPDLEFIDLTVPPDPFASVMWRRARGLPAVASRRWESAHWRMPVHQRSRAALANVEADLVLVNDVPGVPAAFEASRDGRVILDSHEHAPTEYAERRSWRFLGGSYADWLLRTYGPRLSAMTTVSPGIAEAYRRDYGLRVDVILNAPRRAKLEPTPVHTPLRLIHHGVGAERRKLELLIEAVEPLRGHVSLDLRLAPGAVEYIRRLEELAAPLDHVRVLPPVPYEEIVSMVNGYDVGVHLIPPGTLHDYYALPNKLFEFIQGRVAVAIGPSPDMRAVVETHGCGVVAAAPTATAFRDVLAGLDAEKVAELKQSSHRAADVLNAEAGRDKLLGIVERALSAAQPPVRAGA